MHNGDFLEDVESAIKAYEEANGYPATRTREMIHTSDEVTALTRLVISGDLQQGFKVLRDTGQLDKSFESVVLKYRNLFEEDAIEAAEWRLKNPYALL